MKTLALYFGTKARRECCAIYRLLIQIFILLVLNEHVYLNKFPTLQFLILNISAVSAAIKRIFRM